MDFLKQVYDANGIFFLSVFGLLSVGAGFLIVWQLLKNRRAHQDLNLFLEGFDEKRAQPNGLQVAFQWCKPDEDNLPYDDAISQLFYMGMLHSGKGRVASRDAMEDYAELEVLPRLQRLLPAILLIARISPMVGLFGTVAGMIQAFQTIATSAKPEPSALASDIGMALFTTAEGLLIAIPTIFFYSILKEGVSLIDVELQKATQHALDRLF